MQDPIWDIDFHPTISAVGREAFIEGNDLSLDRFNEALEDETILWTPATINLNALVLIDEFVPKRGGGMTANATLQNDLYFTFDNTKFKIPSLSAVVLTKWKKAYDTDSTITVNPSDILNLREPLNNKPTDPEDLNDPEDPTTLSGGRHYRKHRKSKTRKSKTRRYRKSRSRKSRR